MYPKGKTKRLQMTETNPKGLQNLFSLLGKG